MMKVQIQLCTADYKIRLRYLSIFAWFLLINIPLVSKGQDKSKKDADIHFMENSLSAAVQQAKEQNKLIFVDAFTVWCVPLDIPLMLTPLRQSKVTPLS